MFHKFFLLSLLFTILLMGCQLSTNTEEPSYTPCENGLSGSYPCNNIGLYAHVDTTELSGNVLNDIWGWADSETGKEYAIVGLSNGVDIVEVTIPDEPVVIGRIPEINPGAAKSPTFEFHDDKEDEKKSTWRDMKVHENTLYIVSEQGNYGLQIFDLTKIKDVTDPPIVLSDYQRYTKFGNAHNIAVNSDTEYLYVVGSTSGSTCAEHGGLHMIDISEPLDPHFAGCYFDDSFDGITKNGYIHDTQCVLYEGPDDDYKGNEVCFNSAENSFLITDVSDKTNASTIANVTHSSKAYIHQGWLSEDQRYFFMNDELDERFISPLIRTFVWDLEDLDAPKLMGHYQHTMEGIDHNLYVKDNLMFQANYTAGLRILDVSNPDPQQISEIAYFDTTPNNNTISFNGLWSVYPWLSGDKIIVSDINQGLYIFRFQP